MSGQELPAVGMEDVSDVRGLKASLRSLHGFPMCMQQLLHNGNGLDNSTELNAPIDLQLVLLVPCSEAQQYEAAAELAESCDKGDLKVARLLLEAGSDKDLRRCGGTTALMRAAENGHVEMARLLVEAGADKDACSDDGYTALMFAAEKDHVEMARLLLEAGAANDL